MASAADPVTPTDASAQNGDKLALSLKLGWGVGAFGVATLMNGIAVLIFFFMVGILKIEPALAGSILFLTKILDVVSDPIVGLWSDRITSPRGRRRPFLFWGSFIAAASFALIFTAPVFASQWATAAYIFMALCLYTIGYTVFNIPYMAMPAEMTNSYHERSSIHAYRIVFVSLGSFVAASIAPAVLEELGRTDASSYALIGTALAALIFMSMMAAYLGTRKATFTTTNNTAPKLLQEFNAVKDNKHFLRLISVKFMQLLGLQTTQAAMIFFFVQTLELKLSVFIYMGIVMTATSIVSAPILVKFSKRFGKREAYYVAAAANIAYALSWSIADAGEPLWALCVRAFFMGIALTGNVVMAMSMLTDVINIDAQKTGVRREGAYTALYSFVEKFTAALGPLLIGFALSFANFDTSLPPDVAQGGDVDTALLLSVSWLPTLFGLAAIWLLTGYKLTESDFDGAAAAQEIEK